MKKKITFKSIIGNLDAIITAVTLSLCVIIVNCNVLMRYIFKSPIAWCDEIVTMLFVWTVFIGSAYAYRKHAHLGVDIVVNLLDGKSKAVVQDVVAILELLVLIMLTIVSATYVKNIIWIRGEFKPQVTDFLRMPRWYSGIAVPLGFGLSAIYSIYFLLADRLHLIKKVEAKDIGEHKVEGGNF